MDSTKVGMTRIVFMFGPSVRLFVRYPLGPLNNIQSKVDSIIKSSLMIPKNLIKI